MKTIQLGTSSLSGGRVAYGCWRIAGTHSAADVTPERQAQGVAAIGAALEAGCTVFDLADVYCDGMAETIFGRALRDIAYLKKRAVIATKCGIRKRGDGGSEAPYRYDFSAAHIMRSCEASLKRLGVETIDLYQLHRPDYLCDPQEVAGAFDKLRRDGKVREFGVSNFRPSQLAALQKALPMRIAVNQVEISLAQIKAFEDGTLDQCLAETITPMAWSPLGGGRLVTAFPIELQEPNHARRIQLRETIDRMARERGISRTALAVSWLLKHPARIMVIAGSMNPAHIREAVAGDAVELTREEWYTLFEAARGERLP